MDHLSRIHQLPEILPLKDAKRKRADNDIQASIARMKEVGERIRSQRLTNASESEIDPLITRELFVNWLAADSLPFHYANQELSEPFCSISALLPTISYRNPIPQYVKTCLAVIYN
jgi:hypothetical protein